MTKKFNRGFTLIELLVVIAIIGILSSVVLASLNTARNKGANAAIKSNLANARAEAEIYYDTNSTYAGVCAVGGAGTNTIGDTMNALAVITGGTYTVSNAALTAGVNPVCHDAAAGWAAVSLLKPGDPTAAWCSDNTGASQGVAANQLNTANKIICN